MKFRETLKTSGSIKQENATEDEGLQAFEFRTVRHESP